ncbi:MAG TPA: hypothetical protein VMU53_14345 [Candidatus Sulfotelmatobacter sp.]|nr:hypothetical protein [Candidatus Sulfotelmatobacter sp.]
MNRSAILLAAGILCAGTAAAMAQTPAANAPAAQANAAVLPAGAPIQATLEKSLDAKKAKPGEPITARVTQNTENNGKIIMPEGAKLEGRVTEASARAKGAANSSVSIVFDKAVLKHGETIPINVSLRAMALPQSEATSQNGSNLNMDTMGGVPSSGMNRGAMGTQPAQTNPNALPNSYGATSNTSNAPAVAASPGAVGGLNAQGQLTANSKGVFGLPGIALENSPAAQESAMITSNAKDLHLDGGTQMLLVTRGIASANEKPKS